MTKDNSKLKLKLEGKKKSVFMLKKIYIYIRDGTNKD